MKVSFTKILNYLGLTIAFTAFAIIMIQVKWDVTFAKGYPEHERLYRVEMQIQQGANYWVHSCRLLLEKFRTVPEIEKLATVSLMPEPMKVRIEGDANGTYIEKNKNKYSQDALELLGVEFVDGTCNDADSLNKILISTELADMLYSGESAVGKSMEDSNGNKYTISGVFNPLLANGVTSNIDIIETLGQHGMSKSSWNYYCFVRLAKGVELEQVEDHMNKVMIDFFTKEMDYHIEGEADGDAEAQINEEAFPFKARLTPIHETHYNTDVLHDDVAKTNASTLYTLISIAIILILVAMVNFLNISMAEVPTKMRSLNTRKVLGASQLELIWLQSREALKVALLAILTSVFVVYLIGHTSIADSINGSINPLDNVQFFIWLALGTIIVSVLSGLYPAIYSTSFSPALLLKGNFSHSDHGRVLRSGLVGLQFVVSFILIIFAFFVQVQMNYMKGHDKGFRSQDVLYSQIPWDVAQKHDSYSEMLLKHPEILDVTYSAYGLGTTHKGSDYGLMTGYKEQSCSFDVLPVESNFIDFFELGIKDGRGFIKGDEEIEGGRVIFNELSQKQWELEVGTTIFVDASGGEHQSEIVGIVNDFNFRPMQYSVSPVALFCKKREERDFWNWTNIYIKRAEGISVRDINDIVSSEGMKLANGATSDQFSVVYLDEQSGRLYEKEETLSNLVSIACILSGLISIIGILGLVHYETQYRRKEIAVRRVMGGSIVGLLMQFAKIYIKIALICFAAVIPVTIWIISQWLQDYPYQSPIPVWIFIAGFAILMGVILLTVSIKSYRTATDNPTNSLKSE